MAADVQAGDPLRPGDLAPGFAQRRGDVGGEAVDGGGVVGGEDERADALVEDQGEQGGDPAFRRAGEVARDVGQAVDLARVAPGRDGGLIDDGIDPRPAVAGGLEPGVRLGADQVQKGRIRGAGEQDRDVVRGGGPAFGARQPMMLAVEAEG